jgi:glycosyltransferase involved in cell wall biosynthesis
MFYGLYWTQVALTVRAYQCEIVHIQNFSQLVPMVRRLSPRAKIVLHMSSNWLAQFDNKLIDSRLKNVDAIIGCSEYVTEGIRKRFPHHAQRCVTVFNGVDTGSFVPAEPASRAFNPYQIIYIGRISPEKGLHVLLKAFEHVVKNRPEATLQIVGGPYVAPLDFLGAMAGDPLLQKLSPFYAGPSYVERLRQQIRGVLEGRVFINDELPHEELRKRIQNAAVLAQPSLVETFGMPVVEAMACGLPVVASRVGGLPELVADGQTGFLVEPDNPLPLAEALLRLIENPELGRTMGRAGRLRAEKLFSWERIVGNLDRVYTAVFDREASSDHPQARKSWKPRRASILKKRAAQLWMSIW